jgi:nucleotide-binding universal stress UspA family protein
MLSTLIVGVSDTSFSKAAVEYALRLARQHRASLVGLGVVDLPNLCPPQPVPLGGGAFKQERDEVVLKSAHDKTDQLLAEMGRRCASDGIECRTMNLEGDPAELLVRESQRGDLLVVGKKHLPQEEWESSSHTLRSILHHTARPVLCVPENPANNPTALVAFDGSLQSAKTLQLFVLSGLAQDREIHLVTVADGGQAIADRGLEFLRAHKLDVQAHLQEGDHAADRILDAADTLQAGLIVMGAYGQPRVREFIFGSVTKTILRKTKVPLFLYH